LDEDEGDDETRTLDDDDGEDDEVKEEDNDDGGGDIWEESPGDTKMRSTRDKNDGNIRD